jgi:hypothetical protein
MSKYKQCHSCGGNCGGTKKTGCQYRAPKVRSYDQLMSDYREVVRQRDRLQRIIDSRPAINAGLPETYIQWSQSLYVMDSADLYEEKQ